MTPGRPNDSQTGLDDDDFAGEDTSPGRAQPENERAGHVAGPDGDLVVQEFSLAGSVPRTEPIQKQVATQDVYVRLENTIYGPLNSDELAAMLASGEFTGYESASSDLQHWTPLLYHPRMNLTGYADPDATHALLHGHSTLPAASRSGSKVRLEDFADEPPPERQISVPLAQIMLRPAKVTRKTTRGVSLPVYAELPAGQNDAAPESPAAAQMEHDESPFVDDVPWTDEPPASTRASTPPPVPAAESEAEAPGLDDVENADHPTAISTPIRPDEFDDNVPDTAVSPQVVPVAPRAAGLSFSTFEVTVFAIVFTLVVILVYWFVFRV